MSDEIDAVGSLVTGSAVAAQFGKGGGQGDAAAGQCLNCDAPLSGPFCANCGQNAHVPRSIGHVFEELLHGILHVDGKAWKTLPMLAFRPGRLTREYIEGKRKRFIAPFALFLFTIFLTYFTFAMIGAPDMPDGAIDIDSKGVAQLETELAKEKADLAALEKHAAEIAAKPDREPGEGAGMSGDIAGQRVVVRLLEGDCHSPIGAYVHQEADEWVGYACLGEPGGGLPVRRARQGTKNPTRSTLAGNLVTLLQNLR